MSAEGSVHRSGRGTGSPLGLVSHAPGGCGFLSGVRAWLGVALESQGRALKALSPEDMFPGCCGPFECYCQGSPKAEGRQWREVPLY